MVMEKEGEKEKAAREKAEKEKAAKDEELLKISELSGIQKIVLKVAAEIETRLSAKLDGVIASIDAKVETSTAAATELQAKANLSFENLPAFIEAQIQSELNKNIKEIGEQLSGQLEGKVEAMIKKGGGNSGAAQAAPGGLNLETLLANSDKIVNAVNAFRAPTTDQAMMGQMNFVMKWHKLLSNLEKGGGSSDQFTEAIADTFSEKPKE